MIELLNEPATQAAPDRIDDVPILDERSRNVLADWKWYHDQFDRGAFRHLDGMHIAIRNQQVLGVDADFDGLLREVSRVHGLSFKNILTTCVDYSSPFVEG